MTAAAASAAPDFVASLRPKPAPVQPVVVSVPATAVPRPSLATRSDPGTANAAAQAERPALVQQTDAAQAIAPRPVTPVATRNPP
ncbi:MAG: hypothetical protein JF607_15430 [Burkholderiales bacterium]|nr:hypothetical protein [Burkholderiales bacterium]MBW8893774.1 hypothetical protein [Burkholderiales bacterium]